MIEDSQVPDHPHPDRCACCGRQADPVLDLCDGCHKIICRHCRHEWSHDGLADHHWTPETKPKMLPEECAGLDGLGLS